MRSQYSKRIKDLKRKLDPDKIIIRVLFHDLDDPNLLTYNGETMTLAEFNKRYPATPNTQIIEVGYEHLEPEPHRTA